MATITKIERQKKNKRRYSIYIDEKYAFGVNEDVLLKFALRKGATLSEVELAEIKKAEQYKKAYLLAINYLSYRMRSEKEMKDYLIKKEIGLEWIEEIMNRLRSEKYLDDEMFANMFVRDRMHQTSKGPILVERELKEKGVSQPIASQAVSQFDEALQIEKGLHWLEKEFKKKTNEAHRKRLEKVKQKLHQKGYTFEIISKIFTDFTPEIDTEKETEKFTKQANKLYARHSKKYEGYELHMKLKAALYQKGFSRDLIDQYIRDIK